MNKFKLEKVKKILLAFRRVIAPEGSSRGDIVRMLFNFFRAFIHGGIKGLIQTTQGYITGKIYFSYKTWIIKNESWDAKTIEQEINSFSYKPTFSIIVPVYNINPKWLDRCIQSVVLQLYERWELCLYDDASSNPLTIDCLKKWQEIDDRIHITFGNTNLKIGEATNKALEMANGEFVVFLDHDDELSPYALYFVTRTLNKHPDSDLIYSDEDKIDKNGLRSNPYFKPDWNPDLFLSQNYINHLSVYRTEIVRRVGGCRNGLDGAQDWDLGLRVTEIIPKSHIHHIPHILYHWRIIPGTYSSAFDEKPYIAEAQYKSLHDYYSRLHKNVNLIKVGQYWRSKYQIPVPAPLVSLIIPTHNGYELLHRCVESIYQKNTYHNFELLIIDNKSDDPRTLTYLATLEKAERVKVFKYPNDFNFSAINNFAVSKAMGQVVGLLNNDLEVVTPEWLEEMVGQALRPEIGAVGAKLLYPNNTIQHAGIILGIGGVAGHWFKGFPDGYGAQFGRLGLAQNLSAVTGACLLVKKSIYEEVGGLDEDQLKIAFNDVDFCLKVLSKGYRNLYTPFAVLYHHESVSRGYETTTEKKARFEAETFVMKQRWGHLLLNDPYYNSNLDLDREDGVIAAQTRTNQN